MIDMQKVQPNQGYASAYALPKAATGTKASVGLKAPGAIQGAAAPGGYQEPDAGLNTPSGWGNVEAFANAGMMSPYQRSQGVDMGYSGIEDLYRQGGYLTDANAYKRSNDAVFQRQLEEEKQRLRQQFQAGGYGNSSVLGSGLMRGISDMYLNRDLAYADKDLGLQEAAKGRMMQGLGMLPSLAGVENQGLSDWRNAGMGYAGIAKNVADSRWAAPGQVAGQIGQAGTGWESTWMSPYEQALNQQLTPSQSGQMTQYQPTWGQQAAGAIGNSAKGIEDIYNYFAKK